MNNKVVYQLYNAFAERDFSTLRFNFRGVGRSQGTYDRGEGELSDAAAALDWLQTINRNARSVWVAGFSFGAWIGMQLLMRRPEIESFISVAPPANMLDFNFLAPCPASGQIIHGEADEIVPEPFVAKLVAQTVEPARRQYRLSRDPRRQPFLCRSSRYPDRAMSRIISTSRSINARSRWRWRANK